MAALPKKVNSFRVHSSVSIRRVPQLGVAVDKDKVQMELCSFGVIVDQGHPFGRMLVPFANIYEIHFIQEEE